MEILNKLLDPGLWIAGLLIGWVSLFTGQYLERKWGVFSGWTQARREQMKSEKADRIQAWSQNEGLLTIVFLRAVGSAVVFGSILIATFLFVLYLRVEFGEDQNIPSYMIFVAFTMVAASFLAMWASSAEFSTARDCFREFRQKRGLPALKGSKW